MPTNSILSKVERNKSNAHNDYFQSAKTVQGHDGAATGGSQLPRSSENEHNLDFDSEDDEMTDIGRRSSGSDRMELEGDDDHELDYDFEQNSMDSEFDRDTYNIPRTDGGDERLKKSLELLMIVQRYNVSRAGHECLIKFINRLLRNPRKSDKLYIVTSNVPCQILASGPLLSEKTSRKKAIESLPIKPRSYPICSSGCKLLEEGEICSCGCNAVSTHLQMPIGPQLAMLLADSETRSKLRYRHNYIPAHDGSIRDVFDGAVYQRMKEKLFTGPDDIALALFVDGFTPFKKSPTSLTIIHVIVLNFPPEDR